MSDQRIVIPAAPDVHGRQPRFTDVDGRSYEIVGFVLNATPIEEESDRSMTMAAGGRHD